jgi:hypothetical protein
MSAVVAAPSDWRGDAESTCCMLLLLLACAGDFFLKFALGEVPKLQHQCCNKSENL